MSEDVLSEMLDRMVEQQKSEAALQVTDELIQRYINMCTQDTCEEKARRYGLKTLLDVQSLLMSELGGQ